MKCNLFIFYFLARICINFTHTIYNTQYYCITKTSVCEQCRDKKTFCFEETVFCLGCLADASSKLTMEDVDYEDLNEQDANKEDVNVCIVEVVVVCL